MSLSAPLNTITTGINEEQSTSKMSQGLQEKNEPVKVYFSEVTEGFDFYKPAALLLELVIDEKVFLIPIEKRPVSAYGHPEKIYTKSDLCIRATAKYFEYAQDFKNSESKEFTNSNKRRDAFFISEAGGVGRQIAKIVFSYICNQPFCEKLIKDKYFISNYESYVRYLIYSLAQCAEYKESLEKLQIKVERTALTDKLTSGVSYKTNAPGNKI